MTRSIGAFGTIALCVLVAGCGAGGYGTSPGDSYPIAGIPTPGTTRASLASAAQILPLPATTGYNGAIRLPAALSGVGTSVAIYTGIAPQTQTIVPVLAPTQIGSSPAPIPLIYMTFTPAASTTLMTYPGFTINLPADIPPTLTFYVGYFDAANASAGYALVTEGPATIAGSTRTFTPPPTVRPQWRGASPYAFVLYGVPAPTPAPAVTP